MMDGERLTRREALEICEDLWWWLEQTGGEHKGEWPGWMRYGAHSCGCPCCTYCEGIGVETEDGACRYCPLFFTWMPEGSKVHRSDPWVAGWDGYSISLPGSSEKFHGDPCCYKHSPYEKWRNAKDPRTRKKYARMIRDAAEKELGKYKDWKAWSDD